MLIEATTSPSSLTSSAATSTTTSTTTSQTTIQTPVNQNQPTFQTPLNTNFSLNSVPPSLSITGTDEFLLKVPRQIRNLFASYSGLKLY